MRRPSAPAYLLLLPALLAFAAYILYPVVHTCLLSFYSWSTVNQVKLPVGLQNYTRLLQDPNFYLALRNNGLFIALSLAVQLPLALLVGVGLGSSLRRHQVLRTLFFAPFVMPVVAVGLVWKLIYEPNLGALNALLTAAHAGAWASGWLGDSGVAIFAVIDQGSAPLGQRGIAIHQHRDPRDVGRAEGRAGAGPALVHLRLQLGRGAGPAPGNLARLPLLHLPPDPAVGPAPRPVRRGAPRSAGRCSERRESLLARARGLSRFR